MDQALLDTDIFSELLRARNPAVGQAGAVYLASWGQYTISVITVTEVVKGLHKLGRVAHLAQFVARLPTLEVLVLDVGAAQIAGRVYGDLERVGQPIGRMDPLIAALALHHDRVLVTGNQAHYRRVQALGYPLKLADWRHPQP